MAAKGTGFVFGSHAVRAVEVRKKGNVVQLSRVVSMRVDPSDGDPMAGRGADAIRGSLAAERLKPGPAFLGLTGKDLVIRYTQVPPVPDWKLDTLMRYEIDEVSQQSGGDVSADYAPLDLPMESSPDTSVLVAMVKNSLLRPRVSAIESLKLRLVAAVPQSLVLFNAFLWYGDVKPGETTLLVRVGGSNMDVAIQKDGNLLFARNVSGGGIQFTDAISSAFSVSREKAERMKIQKGNVTPKARASYADSAEEKIANAIMGVAGQVLSAIQSSIMFARAQTRLVDLSVERVVLAGGGAALRGFREYLETNLGLPVSVFDPLPALDLSPLSPEERQAAENDAPGIVTALGLATMALEGGGAFWVEILPEAYRKRREFVRGPLFAVLSAVLLAVLIGVMFWTASRNDDELARAKRTARTTADGARRKANRWAQQTEEARLAENRLAKVREIGMLNRTLQRATIAVQKHLVDDIVLGERAARLEAAPKKEEPDDRRDSRRDRSRRDRGDDEQERLHAVVVFKGAVEGRAQGETWARFIEDVKTEEGIAVKDEPMRRGVIEFKVWFPEPDPDAEKDQDGGEG
jgi:type IV pilus assembly protein PilM